MSATIQGNPIITVASMMLGRGDDGGVPIAKNDVGFNRVDYPIARSILAKVDQQDGIATRGQLRGLVTILGKYHRQLGELGYDPAVLVAAVAEGAESIAIPETTALRDEVRTQTMATSATPPSRGLPRMADVLGSSGPIARKLSGYEPRPSQIEVAQFIADAIDADKSVLAEAGTGTGKSLAYLIPAILSGQRTIVSTEGKALQDQLVGKDLPFLRSVLPVDFEYAALKGMSNYVCLAGETRILTRYGARAISDLAGGVHSVRDGNGDWVPAEIQSFGVQRLMQLTVARDRHAKTIYATPDHRWFVQPNANSPKHDEVTTADLVPGARLASVVGQPLARNPRMRPSPFGIAHGVVYGDGTLFKTKDAATATVVLHGAKNAELLRYFPESHQKHGHREGYAEPHIRVCDLPRFFKDRPSLDEAPSYLYGWLSGYFAADGSIHEGQPVISSASRENLEFVRDVCTRLGIVTRPIRSQERVGKGTTPSPLYSVAIVRETIGDDFFLLSTHREKDAPNLTAKRWRVARRWTVVSVEETDRVEEVFCAVVPTTHSFALEDDILTGNCRHELEDEVSNQWLMGASDEFKAIEGWLETTTTGDLAEAPIQVSPQLRSAITTTTDDCLGKGCPLVDTCFVMQARARAKRAQIVVVNHTLLALDLAVRDRTDDMATILPDRDLVIADEAHSLEDVATKAFTDELSEFAIHRLLSGKRARLAEFDPDETEAARKASNDLFAFIKRDERQSFLVTPNDPLRLLGTNLALELAPWRTRAREAATAAIENVDKLALDRYAERIDTTIGVVKTVTGLTEHNGSELIIYAEVEWGQRGDRIATLKRAPVTVANDLKRALWNRWPVVATSATLTTNGDFDYVRERTGCDRARAVSVESPFDYQRNALIYLPQDGEAFDPTKFYGDGNPQYFDRLGREIASLIRASNGRAFCLFTSRRAMDAVYGRIAHRLDWLVLKQGDYGTQELVRRFKDDGNAVLFGLRSFWTGVDVQGEALSLVIVDKLPFPTPDEPVFQARQDLLTRQSGDKWAWFNRLALPMATMQLKQGVGRLVRTKTDTGVMAILDGRLKTKGYGKGVLRSLPPATVTDSMDTVRAFFAARG